MRRATPILAAAIALVASASVAFAATGDLTPIACIDDNDDGSEVCPQSTDGLSRAEAVVVAPDGEDVYAVGGDEATIVRFARNPGTGALTPKGCIEGGGTEPCADSIPGFIDPEDIAISADGRSVYVVSRFADSGVYWFKRTDSGRLVYRGCVGDAEFPSCDQNMAGIDDPTAVALSPDGTSLYLADFGGDAVAWMKRNTTSGKLIPKGCVSEPGMFSEACPNSAEGLSAAADLVVSPNGKQVYVASAFDDAVVRFNRNAATGALGGDRCYDDNDTGPESCLFAVDGLGRPEGIAIAPDGTSLYVAARDDDALVRFNRLAGGGLTDGGCLVDNEFPGEPCGDSPKGLSGAHAVTVSADGKSIYVAARSESAVTHFTRAPDGSITRARCIGDDEAASSFSTCAEKTDGLAETTDVAVSADGSSVYTSSGFNDHAIVHFQRAP